MLKAQSQTKKAASESYKVKYSIFRYALEEAAVAVDLLFILDQL
jgi:hypothetical protein